MAYKIKMKLIMELHAQRRGISADDVRTLSEEEAYQLFYPNKFQAESIYQTPDYDFVHEELSKTGVTLKLLWKEYCDKCKINDALAMGYTRFCEG